MEGKRKMGWGQKGTAHTAVIVCYGVRQRQASRDHIITTSLLGAGKIGRKVLLSSTESARLPDRCSRGQRATIFMLGWRKCLLLWLFLSSLHHHPPSLKFSRQMVGRWWWSRRITEVGVPKVTTMHFTYQQQHSAKCPAGRHRHPPRKLSSESSIWRFFYNISSFFFQVPLRKRHQQQ